MKFEFKYYRHCLLAFAFVSMAVQVCFAQIEFTEHNIAGNFNRAVSVYAADVDGDGNMDMLGAVSNDDDIIWWENDGEQDFTEHTIAGDFDAANSVYVADIDGDGDMDVLGAAYEADDITWWENDGEQDFTEHTIAGNFEGANSVYAADIDGDGDMDVLGAAWYVDDITWWENDGEQDFTEHTIAGDFSFATSVYAADIDDDGDMDVIGAASNDITWWENDGEQDFTEHTITGNFIGAESVYTADIDSDGDMDVLGAASSHDDITWWENDGEQEFTEHTIAGDFDCAWSVYAADIDGDGDTDVLGAAHYGDEIAWWENDGEQDFVEHTIADDFDGAACVYAADIDGDGDMDVIGAASEADEITWWESDLDPTVRWLALPDSCFVEDGLLLLSLEYLYEHIFSPEFDIEDLVISVEDGENLSGEIEDDTLHITADQDWNGIDSLMLIVSDPDENSDSTYQHITVTPVNDLPSAFGLLEPANNTEIADYPTVAFTWEESVDEADGDTVTYDFVMTIDLEVHWYTGIEGTSLEINREDLSIDPNQETSLVWGVWAHDGTDSIFANEPFFLTVAPLSVSEHDAMLPTELSLGPIYPNPFNTTTQVRFGLPYRSAIRITILDIYGRAIATLADRAYEAGFHSIVWDATAFPTGIYFVRLEAGKVARTVKMTLIR